MDICFLRLASGFRYIKSYSFVNASYGHTVKRESILSHGIAVSHVFDLKYGHTGCKCKPGWWKSKSPPFKNHKMTFWEELVLFHCEVGGGHTI